MKARGRRYATTKSRTCWTTSALDSIGSGNKALSREEEFLRKVRRQNNERKIRGVIIQDSGRPAIRQKGSN